MRKKTFDEFIAEASLRHGNKYDYSKSAYAGSHIKICIICPVHGEFWQEPANHLNGPGCRKCSAERLSESRKKDKSTFIKEASEIHSDKYDYSEAVYKNNKIKIRIICPIHGEFWQTPESHLRGCGCRKCSSFQYSQKAKLAKSEFVKRASKIHSRKYSYSETEYTSLHDKIKIHCPVHGSFLQTANNHLRGAGCPCCFRYSKGEEYVKQVLQNIPYKIHWCFPELYDKSPSHPLSFDFFVPQQKILIECNGIQHYVPQEFLGGYKKFLVQKHHDWLKRKYAERLGYTLVTISYKNYYLSRIQEILSPYLSGVQGHVDGLS